MPTHFARDEHSIRDWVKQARYETDSIVPDLPEFRLVRRQLSHGEEVSWERDMQPIIDKDFEGNIQAVRVAAANAGFNSADDIGKIIGDGSFQEAYATAGMSTRVKRYVDEMFTHIGTMPTDELTRSVIFKTVYQREVAQRVQALALSLIHI